MKISLTVEQLRDIVYDDSEEFEIMSHTTTGHWRHGSEEETIVKRVSDGKFFQLNWRDSTNDMNSFEDMNYSGDYDEVEPYEITVTKYIKKKE